MHLRKILSRLTAGCLAAAVLSAPLVASANEYGGLCSKYGEPNITWKRTSPVWLAAKWSFLNGHRMLTCKL